MCSEVCEVCVHIDSSLLAKVNICALRVQWVVWLVFTCGMAGIYRPQLECKIRTSRTVQIVNYTLTACVLLKCTLRIHGAKPSGTEPYQITIAAHLCICALKWVHLSEVHCSAI